MSEFAPLREEPLVGAGCAKQPRHDHTNPAILFEHDRPESAASTEVEPDIASLSPVELVARRLALQAEKLEIETMLNRGTMRPADEVIREFETRNGVVKSLLLALPSRLSQAAEDASPEAFETMVKAELENAFAEL